MRHIAWPGTPRDECRRLQVLFLSAGNGLAAHVAAHWTRRLANGLIDAEADAAGPVRLDLTTAPHSAGLVVVIHAPGNPGPHAIHGGGRIDWHLGADDGADLASQLRRHVLQLLGDLGLHAGRSDADAASAGCCRDPLRHSAAMPGTAPARRSGTAVPAASA